MKGGEELNDPELVKFMTENAADAVAWLTDLGADLSDVGSLGGASFKRAHRPTGGAPVGDHLVNVLYQNTEQQYTPHIWAFYYFANLIPNHLTTPYKNDINIHHLM